MNKKIMLIGVMSLGLSLATVGSVWAGHSEQAADQSKEGASCPPCEQKESKAEQNNSSSGGTVRAGTIEGSEGEHDSEEGLMGEHGDY